MSEVQQQSGGHADDACEQQPLEGDLRRGLPQPAPRHEAENHRPERGDEAEGKVSAVVRDKRTLAREQVQKPLVEGITEVVVLVPVCQETGVIVPEVPGGADAY